MARLITFKDKPKAQRVILFGGPKVGKTTQIGELAKKFKVLLLDIEDSVDSLFLVCDDDALSNIEYIPIKDSARNPVAVTTLLKMWEERKGWICTEHGAWKCPKCTKLKDEFFQIDLDELTPDNNWIIAIDSGTQFGMSAFFHICNTHNVTLTDGDKTSYTIWGAQGAYIERLFSTIQAGNNHVLLIAHEQEVEMPDKSKKLVPSMGTRKVASNFGKYFGHVIRLTKGAAGHKGISTTKSATVESGSRWGLDINSPDVSICDFFVRPEKLPGLPGTKPVTKQATINKPGTVTKTPTVDRARLDALRNRNK